VVFPEELLPEEEGTGAPEGRLYDGEDEDEDEDEEVP